MKNNRYVYAFLGILVMLFAGSIYGWSVYQAAMAQEFSDWAVAQFSLNFSLVITFFCFGTLVVGFFSKKVSLKILMVISAVLIGAGYLISASMHTPIVLYIGYGVMCGFAIGMIYNSVLTIVLKWFPEKSGMMSGILLMGFGFSTMLVSPVFTKINAIAGWRTAFILIGIVTAVIFLLVGLLLKIPTADFEISGNQNKKESVSKALEDVPTQKMLMRPTFWMYFVFAIVLSAGGLAASSHSYAMAAGVLGENADSYATVLSLIVSMFSVLNGLGRLIFGVFFDKLGQNKTLICICGAFGVSCVILLGALSEQQFLLLVVGLMICGFSYGGIQPANSAFVRRNYGVKYYSANFSIIVLNLLVASYLGPLVSGKLYDSMQSYIGTALCLCIYTVIGIFCILGIIIAEKKRKID